MYELPLGNRESFAIGSIEGPYGQTAELSHNLAESSLTPQLASGTVYHANSSGLLDFNAQFRLQRSGSERLVARGMLQVGSDVEGWLLLRAEGWLAVTIDGKLQLNRTAPLDSCARLGSSPAAFEGGFSPSATRMSKVE